LDVDFGKVKAMMNQQSTTVELNQKPLQTLLIVLGSLFFFGALGRVPGVIFLITAGALSVGRPSYYHR
jgi:ABC-type methionine transport system permease subunit